MVNRVWDFKKNILFKFNQNEYAFPEKVLLKCSFWSIGSIILVGDKISCSLRYWGLAIIMESLSPRETMVAHTKCFLGVHNRMGKEVPLASWQSFTQKLVLWILIWVSISYDKELVAVISYVFQMVCIWNLAIYHVGLWLELCHMDVKIYQITPNSVVSGVHVNLLASGWFEWNFLNSFQANFRNAWLRYLSWNCPQVSVTGPHW